MSKATERPEGVSITSCDMEDISTGVSEAAVILDWLEWMGDEDVGMPKIWLWSEHERNKLKKNMRSKDLKEDEKYLVQREVLNI